MHKDGTPHPLPVRVEGAVWQDHARPAPSWAVFPTELCLLLSRDGTVSSHPCMCFCALCFFSLAPVWPFTNTTVFLLCFCYLTFTFYSFCVCCSVTSGAQRALPELWSYLWSLRTRHRFALCCLAPGQALGNKERKEMTALFTRITGAFMRETAKRPGR